MFYFLIHFEIFIEVELLYKVVLISTVQHSSFEFKSTHLLLREASHDFSD